MNENRNYPGDDKDIPVDLPEDPIIPAEPLFDPMDKPPEFQVNIKEDDGGDDMTDLFDLAREDDEDEDAPRQRPANGQTKKSWTAIKRKRKTGSSMVDAPNP